MNADDELIEETAEDLFENAPCGYLSSRPDGTIVRVNRTFEQWTGRDRASIIGGRFVDLLTPAGRIYHETHYAPLIQMQSAVRAIALDIVRRDGSRLPALVNSVMHKDADGQPRIIRTTIFDASDRRRYEQELLHARRREQEIATELQRSLLAGERPQLPGLEIDIFYRPAVQGLEVGGDWYDSFMLDEHRVALVVGDVVGRGITAASTMGQLRSAVRALASTGLGPGALLDALDRYSRLHDVGLMTTVVYAELDLRRRELRYTAAGHPPPVLSRDGDVRFLDEARSPPLDAAFSMSPRPETRLVLDPGTRVVFYTDGLVERRNRSLDDGLEHLLEEIRRRGEPLSLTALARALEDRSHPDDVCLLSARLM